VIYTSRCNFRCPFCHNRQLALGESVETVPQERVLETLASRQGFIDGVVITGGEPTVHKNLYELIAAIRELKLAVKLDTNGYNPEALRMLFSYGCLDFVAMDIKTGWSKYSRATGIKADTGRLKESVALIQESGIACEFRTTCVPSLVDSRDIEEISKLVGASGQYTLQQFQPENTLDAHYAEVAPYPPETLATFLEIARRNAGSCRLIGLQ